jgi:periplasmic protein TonB
MPAPDSSPSYLSQHRVVVIAGAVLLFHALAIWALQSGLLMRAVEIVVPVQVLAQIIEPPKPTPPIPVPPAPVVPKEPPPPVKQAVVKPAPPVPQTQAPPQILAVETPAPSPNAPAPVQIAPPAPVLPPSVPIAAVATPAPVPASSPAKVVLPISDAAYLRNPKPPYPRMSNTMGEQGNVIVRILVGVDGLPKEVELQKTSGFERLDKAALAGVMQWHFVPGKRDGVPEEMWMGTTVKFVLGQ